MRKEIRKLRPPVTRKSQAGLEFRMNPKPGIPGRKLTTTRSLINNVEVTNLSESNTKPKADITLSEEKIK